MGIPGFISPVLLSLIVTGKVGGGKAKPKILENKRRDRNLKV
jgi:hypothetical protein